MWGSLHPLQGNEENYPVCQNLAKYYIGSNLTAAILVIFVFLEPTSLNSLTKK